MGPLERFLTSDWGEVRIGNNIYSVRLLATIAGATLWLGTMLVETGTSGIAAIWTNLLFLLPLVAISSASRTLTIRQLVSLCFLGGFMMAVALLVIDIFMPTSAARDFLVPSLEESCKIAPVLFLLWRWRKSRLWTLAATDVLLMAACSGTGFGVVEDAYIRHNLGWPAQIGWLPVTEISGGRLIVGHGIWSAFAGITIGLGLLFRKRRRTTWSLGASGFVLSIFDHISNNLGVHHPGQLAVFLNSFDAQGYLVYYLFLTGVTVVLTADLYIVHVALPQLPEFTAPCQLTDLRAKWEFSVQKRALAHAIFNYRQSAGLERAEGICMATLLDGWFQNVRSVCEQHPSAAPMSGGA